MMKATLILIVLLFWNCGCDRWSDPGADATATENVSQIETVQAMSGALQHVSYAYIDNDEHAVFAYVSKMAGASVVFECPNGEGLDNLVVHQTRLAVSTSPRDTTMADKAKVYLLDMAARTILNALTFQNDEFCTGLSFNSTCDHLAVLCAAERWESLGNGQSRGGAEALHISIYEVPSFRLLQNLRVPKRAVMSQKAWSPDDSGIVIEWLTGKGDNAYLEVGVVATDNNGITVIRKARRRPTYFWGLYPSVLCDGRVGIVEQDRYVAVSLDRTEEIMFFADIVERWDKNVSVDSPINWVSPTIGLFFDMQGEAWGRWIALETKDTVKFFEIANVPSYCEEGQLAPFPTEPLHLSGGIQNGNR